MTLADLIERWRGPLSEALRTSDGEALNEIGGAISLEAAESWTPTPGDLELLDTPMKRGGAACTIVVSAVAADVAEDS